MPNSLEEELKTLASRYPLDRIREEIANLGLKSPDRTLTFIVNSGMHAIPPAIVEGDVYIFSKGNVDLRDSQLGGEVSRLIKKATTYLQSKTWDKINIIPSGHPLLVVAATLTLYRVTRISPTVLYYIDGMYYKAEVDTRTIALNLPDIVDT